MYPAFSGTDFLVDLTDIPDKQEYYEYLEAKYHHISY